MTYEEYIRQREEEKSNLNKVQARAPEALKLKNIEKPELKDDSVQKVDSKLAGGETYVPNAVASEFGFNTGPNHEEEEEDRRPFRGGRGRGRGRGERGAPRGGRGAPRGGRKGGNKIEINNDDFPTL